MTGPVYLMVTEFTGCRQITSCYKWVGSLPRRLRDGKEVGVVLGYCLVGHPGVQGHCASHRVITCWMLVALCTSGGSWVC